MRAKTPKQIFMEKTTVDVALVGNPNAGKSSVFNALTGLRQKIGNYPGVTVEKKSGLLRSESGHLAYIHDLPGLYSLTPSSIDEQIAADIIRGRSAEGGNLKLIVVVVDATNLSRNLYLVTQIIERNIPVILALNMVDAAAARGLEIDIPELSQQLGIPVMPVIARNGTGIVELRQEILALSYHSNGTSKRPGLEFEPGIRTAVAPVEAWLRTEHDLDEAMSWPEAVRMVSSDKALNVWQSPNNGSSINDVVRQARDALSVKQLSWRALETRLRYAWIDDICKKVVHRTKQEEISLSEKADRVLTHKILGPLFFFLIFAVIFQTIFTWAEVPMDAIETAVAWFGEQVARLLPDGVVQDLIVNGAITGVGAILVFLPQILFLFFFLSLLEATGYMARAAFIMDRFMRAAGLSGRSVIPLLSSFACAIPGIMATRTINNTRDRLITIFIAPFMSCSARLPVYALMIGAFIPNIYLLGVFSVPGLTLLSMYTLGIVAAILSAQILKRVIGKSERPSTFVMELPPYRMPSVRWTLLQMWERAKIFATDAGKIILAMSIVLWFLASYPKPDPGADLTPAQTIEQSFAGRLGKAIEPVIEPLGFNWKLGVGLITSFAAREVLVSTLATIYNVEENDDAAITLRDKLRNERDPETGKPAYTPLVAISLMVFFVLACQCMSTVAVVKRETNSWRWPVSMIVYMTLLAYVTSMAVFQGGLLLGFN